MLAIKLLDAAEAEMADAISWYEEHESGLGSAFREAVETTIAFIVDNPSAYPIVFGSTIRRAIIERFPYIVVYSLEPDQVLIVSVFHTSRNPIVWRGRIG